MEIYADEQNDIAYVGDGRGPFTMVGPDGPLGESYLPRNAGLVFGEDVDEIYARGYDEGREQGLREMEEIVIKRAVEADAERRRLTFLVALRYRPMRLTS